MFCHGELARRRPAPSHLTLFYLMVSLGGALGGVFVALIAPRAFHSYLELPLGLVACGILTLFAVWPLAGWTWLPQRWAPWPARILFVAGIGALSWYLVTRGAEIVSVANGDCRYRLILPEHVHQIARAATCLLARPSHRVAIGVC